MVRCVLALTDGAVWTEALLDAHGNDYPDRSSGVGRHSSAGEGESQSNPELLGLSGARIKASVIVANLGAPSLRAAGSFSTGNAYDDACPFQLEVDSFSVAHVCIHVHFVSSPFNGFMRV